MLTRSTFPGAGPSLLRLDKHSRPLCWAPRGHVSGRFMNARWPGANTPLWCTHLHAFSGGLLGVRLPGSQVWEGQPPPPARGLHLPTPGAGAWRTFAEERVEECLRGTRDGARPRGICSGQKGLGSQASSRRRGHSGSPEVPSTSTEITAHLRAPTPLPSPGRSAAALLGCRVLRGPPAGLKDTGGMEDDWHAGAEAEPRQRPLTSGASPPAPHGRDSDGRPPAGPAGSLCSRGSLPAALASPWR